MVAVIAPERMSPQLFDRPDHAMRLPRDHHVARRKGLGGEGDELAALAVPDPGHRRCRRGICVLTPT
jgi:hypothetical protein